MTECFQTLSVAEVLRSLVEKMEESRGEVRCWFVGMMEEGHVVVRTLVEGRMEGARVELRSLVGLAEVSLLVARFELAGSRMKTRGGWNQKRAEGDGRSRGVGLLDMRFHVRLVW